MTQATGSLHGPGPVRLGAPAPGGGRRSLGLVARSLFALTKPRIIELLLVTTLPCMVLAAGGLPSWTVALPTLLGGPLAAGIAVRLWAIRTLGRFFSSAVRLQDDHALIVTGPYAIVRHPSYLGAFLVFIGIALLFEGAWSLGLTAGAMLA